MTPPGYKLDYKPNKLWINRSLKNISRQETPNSVGGNEQVMYDNVDEDVDDDDDDDDDDGAADDDDGAADDDDDDNAKSC